MRNPVSERKEPAAADASRRALVVAGAAGLTAALTACGGGGGDGGGTEETGSEETGGTAGTELARTTDIPEGGGKVFADRRVVVTQPTRGEFRAFSAICTHQRCTVSSVSGGTVNCPCHGSRFAITDGGVRGGPARRPLPPREITVENGTIRLA
ncbi:Rieske (2Fe-2S) protein [Streptomyces pactum]|uniref:Cytochrome bc1 complex Rieske iron-sulfur subunit n=1 Tax=Streptomyces pactum TaxID=68249 RepID=A0ABS0NF03_9ACTN|nr:Rieske (2Fe-2S) protein [Streptomyces pactum]MBH5333738.1 Rieske (2Fe-2S) protein [Streptomyces pactum]